MSALAPHDGRLVGAFHVGNPLKKSARLQPVRVMLVKLYFSLGQFETAQANSPACG
jgi:hypothetical protein